MAREGVEIDVQLLHIDAEVWYRLLRIEEMLGQLRETVTTVMCHLELQIEASGDFDLMADDSGYIETRDDPAFGGGEREAAASGATGLHPAAATRLSAEPTRVFAATADADEVPPP